MTQGPDVAEREPFHAEVVGAKKPRRTLIVATGTGVLGACVGTLACVFLLPPRVRAVTITPLPERVVEHVPVVIEPAPPVPLPLPPPPITDVELLFTVGAETYYEIKDSELPKHAAPVLVEDGFATVATAEVAPRNLPSDLRDWKQRTVIVDGSCEAHFAGFAIVARVRGAPRDADDLLTDWTAKNVMEYGSPILAARLEGCSGTFARDAVIPGITVLADTNAPGDLPEHAMERFASEDVVVRAQDAWKEAEREGTWYEADDATVETHVMRHPGTGVLWVIVHAFRYNDCGEVGGDVVALYRAEPDGKLTEATVRTSALDKIDQVIDLEGDGELELVGPSSGASSIERANGDTAASRGVVQFGCGC